MKSRRQIFGQHFLHDEKIISDIVSQAETQLSLYKHEITAILEVGPGELALTRNLYDLAKSHGLPLFVVELDERLKAGVLDQYPDLSDTFHLIDAASDAFGDLLLKISQETKGKILFVSNLPYSAGSQILAQLCANSKTIAACVVMVQKEVSDRMVALTEKGSRKEAGSFTYLTHAKFESTHLFDVAPKAFSPPPKVWSSVLRLEARRHTSLPETFDFDRFEIFIKRLFSQRRKMIRKALAGVDLSVWQRLGLSGQERIEELSFEQTIALFLASTKGV